MNPEPLRTLILDDEPLARARMRRLLESVGGPLVEIVAELESPRGLEELAQRSRIDAAFIDIRMPGQSGLELARSWPGSNRTSIVFVTAFPAYAVSAFEVGAADYLTKPVSETRLLGTLHRLLERHAIVTAEPPGEMSDRQRQLLALLGEGLSNKEIGRALGVSHFTVRNNLVDLFRLFGVSRRSELARVAARMSDRTPGLVFANQRRTGTSGEIVAREEPAETVITTGFQPKLRAGRPL